MYTPYYLPVPAKKEPSVLTLGEFKGVDFTNNPIMTSPSRSPKCKNMISDMGGFPVKRDGYSQQYRFSARINGLHSIADRQLCHSGTKLWLLGDTPVELSAECNDARSVSFCYGNMLYMLDGGRYIRFDPQSNTVQTVSDIAYVPTTVVSRLPAGGGTSYESVNMLSKYRKNAFLSDGVSTVYQLDAQLIDDEPITVTVSGTELTENTDFTVNRATGSVSFVTPPALSEVEGQDNVIITFAKFSASYDDMVNMCTVCGIYGSGSDTRVWLTGNAEKKNFDWHCEYNDPSYFPDLGYTAVGGDATAIVGYSRQYGTLIVQKEDSAQEATAFLRSDSTDADGRAVFPIKQGTVGVGAISRYSFACLGDDPLFLSKRGVCAYGGTSVELQRTIKNRSYFVDGLLCTHERPEEAVAISYDNYYYLALDGVCYVADGRQRSYISDDFVYEWYYWDNIPARVFGQFGGRLWFGSADGAVYRFYRNEGATGKNDDGRAIEAYWVSPILDFGDFSYNKTVKSAAVLLKPYARSSVRIKYITDALGETTTKEQLTNLFSFDDVDFDEFTFKMSEYPHIAVSPAKAKRLPLFQIAVENDRLNEEFGLYALTVRYVRSTRIKG